MSTLPDDCAPGWAERLEPLLQSAVREWGKIIDVSTGQSPYHSSHLLCEGCVRFEAERALPLVLKCLSREAMPSSIRDCKPPFVYDPAREALTYRAILAPLQLGTAHCYGCTTDPAGREWLVLEKVAGEVLTDVGELDCWQEAARWLARLHAQVTLGRLDPTDDLQSHLVRYDAKYFRKWLDRAIAFHQERGDQDALLLLNEIERTFDAISSQLSGMPMCFLHGEFYASNLLIERNEAAVRVCPLDWEMAGLGPPLLDLAALTSGRWSDEARQAMISAYQDELHKIGRSDFDCHEGLACCRLLIALQWLGWSRQWSPPLAHAHDWLSDAASALRDLQSGEQMRRTDSQPH